MNKTLISRIEALEQARGIGQYAKTPSPPPSIVFAIVDADTGEVCEEIYAQALRGQTALHSSA